ncbi:MAG TPA: hypothetical protein VEY07_06325 [Thermoplasmata archaeon]|nr:hypothetical protein [Thermoplasmata archaeon]
MQPWTPEGAAWTLHETFLEVLRRLNQAAEEGFEVHGMEFPEIERAMTRFWTSHDDRIDLTAALNLLVENGLVGAVEDPQYSWVRSRTVGRRFIITALGKRYLIRQLEESGRIR